MRLGQFRTSQGHLSCLPAVVIRAGCIVMLARFGFVAVRATDGDLPNTGMADPVALVSAFDRFAAAGTPPNIGMRDRSRSRFSCHQVRVVSITADATRDCDPITARL